jgi:hypothetical protein
VALLSGRNFETKQYEEAIAEESFAKLKTGILNFINKTHFDRLTMILRSAGFVTSDLIGGQNAVNFAYILYLRGRAEKMPAADIERLVRRWYVMSLLRGRYAGSPETAFDFDIRQIEARGLRIHRRGDRRTNCPTASGRHAAAAHGHLLHLQPLLPCLPGRAGEARRQGFPVSRHHRARPAAEPQRRAPCLPAKHLKGQGLTRGRYNQIANFVLAQSEINIAIGDKPPEVYFL